jgi:hypothetical protein
MSTQPDDGNGSQAKRPRTEGAVLPSFAYGEHEHEFFEAHGYVALPGLLSPATLADLRATVDQ